MRILTAQAQVPTNGLSHSGPYQLQWICGRNVSAQRTANSGALLTIGNRQELLERLMNADDKRKTSPAFAKSDLCGYG